MSKSIFCFENDIVLNFLLHGHTKDFGYIINYGWKYIFSCVTYFVSIVLNFCAICHVDAVKRKLRFDDFNKS